jgi:hypothetical protein
LAAVFGVGQAPKRGTLAGFEDIGVALTLFPLCFRERFLRKQSSK